MKFLFLCGCVGIAGAWVNCLPITFYCADDNFCQWPCRREKVGWENKMWVRLFSSHTQKTIKSEERISGGQFNKIKQFN